MVTFSYHIEQTRYDRTLPTRWSELTIRGLMELQRLPKPTPLKYISVMTSTPMEHIEAFPKDLTDILTDAIAFLYDDSILLESECPFQFKPLGEVQVNQFEHWRIRPTAEHTIALLHDGAYQFSQRMAMLNEILELPADIGLYWQNYYNNEFAEHVKKFAPLYEPYEPSDEEFNAGYDDLRKWGIYSTYEDLAQGDIFRMEKVAELAVDNVYYFLLYKKTKNEYHKNLSDYAIQRAKNHH